MYWKDNNGNIYGPFSQQDDGFPNAGEVVRAYRKSLGLSQMALGTVLGVRRLQVMNMENHNQVPQNLSRRRALASILKIPPALLGVGVIGTYLEPLEGPARAHASLAAYNLQEAKEYLDAAWEVNFHTSAFSLLPGALRQHAKLKEQLADGGSEQEEKLNLLFHYKHFLLMVGRERQDYTITDPVGLIDVARQIDDPDTIGISLFRRGKMYFEQQNYQAALTDIREALAITRKASPQIRGFTLVGSGPVLAHLATDHSDVLEVLKLLDEGETYVDQTKGAPDPFRTSFDADYCSLIRASTITTLLQLDPSLIDEVWNTLEHIQKRLKPQQTRRKISTEFRYAKAAFHTGDHLSAVSTALDALEAAQSANLVHFIKAIQRLYSELAQTKIKDTSELRALRQALARQA